MSVKYINGSGYPILRLISPNFETQVYSLPKCSVNGLTEVWEEVEINHDIISTNLNRKQITRKRRFIGWRGHFTLDYSTYIKGSELEKIINCWNLWNSDSDNIQIQLQPRHDITDRIFNVHFKNKPLVMNILKGGTRAVGNKGVVIEFETKDLLSQINYVDPNDIYLSIDSNNYSQFNTIS